MQSTPPPAAGSGVDTESIRLSRLSLPARLVIAVFLGGIAVFTAWHLTAVFLFVAPSNTITNEHNETIRGYVFPEFEQNWKLFAPNPLQRDVAVHARAEVRQEDGSRETGEWIDLTAQDIDHIRHNPLPSHAAQNQLRRAWDFLMDSRDDEDRPVGMRGEVSESYVHRIALARLADRYDLQEVTRIQLRSATTRVPAPPWSGEEIDTSPDYHALDWWVVTSEDLPGGALAGDATTEGARP